MTDNHPFATPNEMDLHKAHQWLLKSQKKDKQTLCTFWWEGIASALKYSWP